MPSANELRLAARALRLRKLGDFLAHAPAEAVLGALVENRHGKWVKYVVRTSSVVPSRRGDLKIVFDCQMDEHGKVQVARLHVR